MNKASTRTIIYYAIQFFGTIILLLCASIFFRTSGELSAIFIGAAYILYGVSQALRTGGKASLVISIVGAVVLGLGLITYFVVIGGRTIDDIIGFVMKCVSGVFLLILIIDQPIYSKRYSIKRRIRDLVYFAHALIVLLILGGAALSIFVQPIIEELGYHFQFYILSIIGCAIWVVVTIYTIYLMATHEYDDTVLKAEAALFGFMYKTNAIREYGQVPPKSSGGKNSNPLSLTELEKVTKKIADFWTGTSDILTTYSGVVTIKYYVTFEVIGWDTVNYTINGKLSGIDEKNASKVKLELHSALNKLGDKIKEDTRKELQKRELLHSYEIHVNIGNIA